MNTELPFGVCSAVSSCLHEGTVVMTGLTLPHGIPFCIASISECRNDSDTEHTNFSRARGVSARLCELAQ